MTEAPTANKIQRNEGASATSEVRIESLTPAHFAAARKIENEFIGAGKGFCFGLCPYRLCPLGPGEFEGVYRKSADRCKTYGVAILVEEDLVVGICKARCGGQPANFDENLLHTPELDEVYVDTMAVTKEARGKGVGTKLLQWAEDLGRSRKATKMTLGVVNGNPAQRLYVRAGYKEMESSWFVPACFLGRPNGSFGAVMMEKPLSYDGDGDP